MKRPGLDWEGIERMDEQLVEVEQFPALALPPHPYTLASIEDAVTVQQEKRSAVLSGIFFIQLIHESKRQHYQRAIILVRGTRSRIWQIREQAKVDILVLICEVARLQFFKQLRNLLLIHQKSRHDDQRRHLRRNALRKIQLRQRFSLHQGCDTAIDQIDCALRHWQQSQQQRANDRPVIVMRNQRKNNRCD